LRPTYRENRPASVTTSVEPRDLGIAGAAQQMVNQVGVVVGITVMQMVQQSRVEVVGQAASYRWGYLTGLVLAAGAVLTAPRIVAATSARVVFEGGEGSPSPVDAVTDAAPVADPIP